MVNPIIPAEVAARASKASANALTGDIYVRRSTRPRVSGKGKKKRTETVESEIHVNPVSLAIGAAVTAATVGGALWLMQMRAKPMMVKDTVTVTRKTIKGKGHWVYHSSPVGLPWNEWIQETPDTYIWEITKLGRKYTGDTARNALWAYDKSLVNPSISSQTVDRVVFVVGMKKTLSIESRKGFNVFGAGSQTTTEPGQPETVGHPWGSPLNALFGPLGFWLKPFK